VIRVLKDRFNVGGFRQACRSECGRQLIALTRHVSDGDLNLLTSNEYYDPHAIAGLLKSFLRELPSHLLTRGLRPEFLQVIGEQSRDVL
jgi:hypothetical protein